MRLVLSGFKNSGKTTYGKLFSLKHSLRFYDTDDLIKKHYNDLNNSHYSTREIYQKLGPEAFRDFESETIMKTTFVDNAIISTGGGTILMSRNVDYLKSLGKLIYLKVDADELYQRLIAQDQLPAFISKATPKIDFAKMHKVRSPLYEQAADFSLDCTHLNDNAVMLALEGIYGNTTN